MPRWRDGQPLGYYDSVAPAVLLRMGTQDLGEPPPPLPSALWHCDVGDCNPLRPHSLGEEFGLNQTLSLFLKNDTVN